MDFLFRNTALKALAAFIAVLLWVFVSAPRREKLLERAFEVPIVFSGVPQNLIITGSVQDKVTIRLRGSRSTLNSLPVQNLTSTLDLSNIKPGEVTMTVGEQSLNIPQNIELVSIDPARITFKLETLRQRDVPVRPFLVGELPAGYQLGEVVVTPRTAMISGPSSLVANITEAATERVILTGRTEPFVATVGIGSDYPLVRILQPDNVQVSVGVIAPAPPVLPNTTTDSTATSASPTTSTP
ncbi:MAG: CdaR family protein [Acidobacteriota bacterium]